MCASEFIFQMFISIQVLANYEKEMNITTFLRLPYRKMRSHIQRRGPVHAEVCHFLHF